MGFSLIACSVLFTVPASPGFTVTTVDALDLPQRLAAADLDGNHRVDLFVVADGPDGSRLQVLLNHGGHFTPGWTKSYANGPGGVFDVDLADTDNDGDRDVVFCIGIGAPGQLFNDGLGNFDALGLVPTLSVRFENELVDINGNGT
ncbi:MAG TPA: VCBS repeat-containing protein, partial [Planctomycetota bacterium]|nr:VCBS repeat-containing protein [Planctomycetota bacterium]